MIGLLGAKIWKENGVDFGNPVNLVPLAAGIIIGIGNVKLCSSPTTSRSSGIALGTIVTIAGYHLARALAPARPARRSRRAPRSPSATTVGDRTASRTTPGTAHRHPRRSADRPCVDPPRGSPRARAHCPGRSRGSIAVKPAPFVYHRRAAVDEAVAVLAEVGHDGKVLAGGQSLVPILNDAPGRPRPPRRHQRHRRAGRRRRRRRRGVRVGALARHADVERHAAAYAARPLLRQALATSPTPRSATAAPRSAQPRARRPGRRDAGGAAAPRRRRRGASAVRGTRAIAAGDFFVGPLESALATTSSPWRRSSRPLPPGTGTAFLEVARRHGDYALCGVAVAVVVDGRRPSSARGRVRLGDAVPTVLDLSAASPADAPPTRRTGTRRSTLARGASSPRPTSTPAPTTAAQLARVLTGGRCARPPPRDGASAAERRTEAGG